MFGDPVESTAWATWALVGLALLSAVVAVWALRAAGRSASAARASAESAATVARVEEERRHDELTPDLRAALEFTGTDHDIPVLVIENRGQRVYEPVEVVVERPAGERPVIAGFPDQPENVWRIARLEPGDRPVARVYMPDRYGGQVRVRCVCWGQGDQRKWTVYLSLDVPPDPVLTVY